MENWGTLPILSVISSLPAARIAAFRQVSDLADLAAWFGITKAELTFLLNRKPAAARYTSFSIRKKNGSLRVVDAPILPLRKLQRQLADLLLATHSPRKAVFGFAAGRSIVGNATIHSKRRWVLNLDLEDFFPSIHFGRIAGMFQGYRFSFPRPVALALAQLCCHKGRLPQGAPTSPVLSNIVCDRLDAQLIDFVRRHGSRYSRYCDDITISTTKIDFPVSIASAADPAAVQLSPLLTSIISANGFTVNAAKTRLHHRHARQEVTGLTVNVKPNVRRRVIRQVRAMLHAWRTHTLPAAQAEFQNRWDTKDRGPRKHPPQFANVVRGKIEFIGAVRGHRDPVYVKLLRQFLALSPDSKSRSIEDIDAMTVDVFLCHASEDKPAVVEPLAKALEAAGISYFLDAEKILWGDSVTNVINRALVGSRFVLVVISSKSLDKHWPLREMNAALAREASDGTTRVLPLLVGATSAEREALWKRLPLQGDKLYLEWSGDPSPVVEQLRRRLAPAPVTP